MEGWGDDDSDVSGEVHRAKWMCVSLLVLLLLVDGGGWLAAQRGVVEVVVACVGMAVLGWRLTWLTQRYWTPKCEAHRT